MTNNTIRNVRITFFSAVCNAILMSIPLTAHAAPGTLSPSPLFLTSGVEPNVFFLSDDSGSMDWGLITNESDGIMNLGGLLYYHVIPTTDNVDFWVVPSEEELTSLGVPAPYGGVWRGWNSSYNRLYYNPGLTYTPWSGVDNGSVAYADSNPTAARSDPFNASSQVIDLTATTTYDTDYGLDPALGVFSVNNFYPARYYSWTDSDSDGVIDADDTHTLVEIRSTTPTYAGGTSRSDCAAAPTCTYAEEIQNFANWFSYQRRREFSGKNALGQVITNLSNMRAGYGTINNNGSVKIEIASMNSDPTTGNKKSLLDNLYTTQSTGGTPLRGNLNKAGKYYECVGGDFFGGSAACPILPEASGGSCQQNFTVLLTDGFYNGSDPSPKVNNTDGDDDTTFDGSSYADTYDDTLADIAMEYYERDLANTISNAVQPIAGLDEAEHQHMVTYTVAFGIDGSLDPFDTKTPGDATDTDPTDPGFSWPDPTTGDGQKIDDLWHAAYNSRGKYLNAQDPTSLANSISDALINVSDRTSSAAAVAFNTTSLSTNSAVYFARFKSAKWAGELFSFPLDPITGEVQSSSTWEISNVLDGRNVGTSPRVILTNGATDGIGFQWTNLTNAQKDDLRTNPSGGVDADTVAEARLNFIRGDRSNEGTGQNFRIRGSRLGDIIHSNPVFVGKPALYWPDASPFPTAAGTTYSDFKAGSASSRTEVVYVGTNDGMLHGFKASDGEEVLGYIPDNLFSTGSGGGLHYLTDSSYAHRYYVDLSPALSDVYIKTCVGACPTAGTDTENWRTILIGGERGGGRGLFALDITDPSLFSEANATDLVLWEFTDSDDADLGYLFGEPIMALMNNGEWAAVFGNGYNSTGNGEAQLLIVFLEGGLDGTWTLGTDYIKISTGVGSVAPAQNGLSASAVLDTDGNGTADRVYAGDLEGNMWVFDLSDATASNWKVAYKQGSTPKPLFTAINNASQTQPITSRPTIASNATVSGGGNSPNKLVFFGTGQYLVNGDLTNTDDQSFYGIWDHGSKELARSDLLEQTIVSGTFTDADSNTVSDIRVTTDNAISYSGGSAKDGWYMDLPDSGERVVVNSAVRGDLIFFNTLIPDDTPCSSGGYGFLMAIKQENGGRPDSEAFDLNGDGIVDEGDLITVTLPDSTVLNDVATSGQKINAIPAASTFLSNRQYTPDTSGNIHSRAIEELSGSGTGRFSWIELGRD